MPQWSIAVPAFLTAAVEWVEAFTIVLAVSLSIGWRSAGGAALAALATLVVLVLAGGGVLALGAHVADLQVVIGVLLLLFGVRWLAKAVARQAGRKAFRDEAHEFEETQAELSHGSRAAAWGIAYKGVLLEGLEVWLVVVALGSAGSTGAVSGTGLGAWASAAGAAILALVIVMAAGLAVRGPLTKVPENLIKLTVGTMLVAFGTFWTLEGLGGEWPGGDWALLALVLFYGAGAAVLSRVLRPRLIPHPHVEAAR